MPRGSTTRWSGLRCFNGAAARELRMRALHRRSSALVSASMGPQLVSCGCEIPRVDCPFGGVASMGPQLVSCGCRIGSVECSIKSAASMGPQLVSCGCCCSPRASARSESGFNGAAARELRMQQHAAAAGWRGLASMGPQLVSCGCFVVSTRVPLNHELQWGRSS